MKTKHIILLYLFVFGVLNVQAQAGRWKVEGIVVDSLTKETMPFVTVAAWNTGSQLTLATHAITKNDGSFSLTLPKEGVYKLSLLFLGKKPYECYFELNNTRPSINLGNIYMHDLTINLQEVTIIGRQRLIKANAEKISYNVKNDPESVGSSVLDIMSKVPMISVDGDNSIQLSGNSNFEIYLNGRPSKLFSINPSQVLKSLPAYSVKSIEVITNPGAKYDAEGAGGIINIVTDRQYSNGYTGSVETSADRFGAYSGNGYFTLKHNRLGVTANYGYNHNKEPETELISIRNDSSGKLTEEGTDNSLSKAHLGFLDMSYELDSMNLINTTFNVYTEKGDDLTEQFVRAIDSSDTHLYEYNRISSYTPSGNSISFGFDYQHTTPREDEMFTFSYLMESSMGKMNTQTDIINAIGREPYSINLRDKSKEYDHIFQSDYVYPFSENYSMDVGMKYTHRDKRGTGSYFQWDEASTSWNHADEEDSDFRQKLDILAFYNNHTFVVDNWGFHAGLRLEHTSMRTIFLKTEQFTGSKYLTLVPAALISHELNDENMLRFGYNMRIHRPDISYLNPYRDESNPTDVYFGNPNLDTEKNHRIYIDYSYFGDNVDLNINLSNSLTNNSIQEYTYYENDVTYTTYSNFGKRRQSVANLYLNWTPVNSLRFTLNGASIYTKIGSRQEGVDSRSGYSNRIIGNLTYQTPFYFRASFSGGYYQPAIRLQRTSTPYYYTRISLRQELLNRKLMLGVSMSNPFTNKTKYVYTTSTPDFVMEDIGYRIDRSLTFRVVYQFGNIKISNKKTDRSISSDDYKIKDEAEVNEE